ncbi:hypothetical protein O983_11120, partial [Mycobacterium avium 09-5983]
MRIAVTGASGVLGRGLAARLLSKGHDVVGIARHRPDSWSSAADFIEADIRDAAAVNRAVTSADVVAHFAWTHDTQERTGSQVNIAGTANVLAAMAETSARRIVFPSSPHVYGGGDTPRSEAEAPAPSAADAVQQARVEEMLVASGLESVTIRCALVVGRNVDNWVRRVLALPAFPGGTVDRPIQLVHLDDALRLLESAVLSHEIPSGTVNLAAPGTTTFRRIAATLRRPVLRLGRP